MTKAERDAAREARNAYLREWRRKNPQRVRELRERYWLRKARKQSGEVEESGER